MWLIPGERGPMPLQAAKREPGGVHTPVEPRMLGTVGLQRGDAAFELTLALRIDRHRLRHRRF